MATLKMLLVLVLVLLVGVSRATTTPSPSPDRQLKWNCSEVSAQANASVQQDASKQGKHNAYARNATATTTTTTNESDDLLGSGSEDIETTEADERKNEHIKERKESSTVSLTEGLLNKKTNVTDDPKYGKILIASSTTTTEATNTTTSLPPMVHNVTLTSNTSSYIINGSSISEDPNDIEKFSSHEPQPISTTEQSDQTSASDMFTSTEYNSSKVSTIMHNSPSTVASTVSGGTADYYLLYGSSTEYSTESTSLEGPTSTISEGKVSFSEASSEVYTGSTTSVTNDYSSASKDESSSSAPLTVERQVSLGSKECDTNVCYKQAVHMLSMMNHTMDPCEDFYVFACGGLQSNPNLLQPDPEKYISQKIFSVLESVSNTSSPSLVKMKNFYHSCMAHNNYNTAGYQYIFQVLEKIFQYNGTHKSSAIYTELFSMLLKYNSSPLFDVLIDVEDKINPHFVFKIVGPQYSPSIFSHDKQDEECKLNVSKFERKNGKPIRMDDTYFNYKLCKKNIDITDKIFKYVNSSGYEYLISEETESALGDLRSLMSLFNDVATIRHGLLSKNYVAMSVKELETKYTLINWKKLFSNLVNNSITVKETDTVQVYFKSIFDIIFEKLQNFTQSDPDYIVYINNALHALTLHRMLDDIVTVHNPCNRHDYCINIMKTLMTDIASTAYLNTFTYKELFELNLRANKTFHQLKNTIREQLIKATWLDEQSKSTTIEQLDEMSIAADNGMDFYHNFSYVDSIWENVVIEKDNYVQNALELVHFRRNVAFSLYGKDPRNPKYIWSHFKYPINIGAHFIYGLNMIIIPTSLLSLESNNADLPQYIRMASEGFIMAHEIAHTFDFTGIMFGPYGKGDSQLTQNSKSTYEQMEFCYNFQYDFLSSFLAEDGYHLDFKTESLLSNNERFSDYTGIKLAYDTFINNYNNENKLPLLVKHSPNQLFFLQAAQEFCSKHLTYDHFVSIYEDEHLPSAIRVKNMMSNTKEFLDVFNCKNNNKMRAANHCEPFPNLKEDDMGVSNR